MGDELPAVRVTATEVTHPLVRHKLGLLRDVNTDTEMFRRLVNELTLLLTYEATKEMGLEEIEVETPLERTKATASRARRSPSARSCVPGWGCSTACSR